MRSPAAQIGLAIAATLLVAGVAYLMPSPAVLIALGLAPLAAYFAFRNPFVLCLAFILFSFFRLHEAFPVMYPLKIPQMLAIGTLVVLAVHLLFRRIEIAWSPELKLFAMFFCLVTIGMFFATGRDIAIGYWTDTYVKIGLMVFAIASLARSPADFALASRSIVIAGMSVAYVALYNSVNKIDLVEGTRVSIGRTFGSVLGDPNDLSLVLAFPLSFAISLVITRRTGWFDRVLGGVGGMVLVAAVIATQSRGGLLGMVAVFAVYGAQRIKSKALLISIGVVGLLGLFAVAGISGRQSGGAAEAGLVDESAEGRFHAWGAAVSMAIAHPLTGVGLNNYVANYWFYSTWWEGFAKAVHSTWFSALAESGFLGFGIFITMIVRMVRTAMRAMRQLAPAAAGAAYQPAAYSLAQALVAGIAGFATSGTFLTQAFTWPIYVLLALSVAVGRYSDDLWARRSPAAPAEVAGTGV